MNKTETSIVNPYLFDRQILLIVLLALSFFLPLQISAQQAIDTPIEVAERLKKATENEQKTIFRELVNSLKLKERVQAIEYADELIGALEGINLIKSKTIAIKAQLLSTFGELENSISTIDGAIELSKSINDTLLIYFLQKRKGYIYQENSHYDRAITTFLTNVELLKGSNYYLELGNTYLDIGNLKFAYSRIVSISDFTDPIQNLHAALNIFETKLEHSHDVLFNRMNATNTIALCYAEMGNYDSAYKYYDKALPLAKELNSTFWVALINGNTATLYLKQGLLDKALTYFKRDKNISLEAKEINSAMRASISIAEIYIQKKQFDSATNELNFAEEIVRNINNPNIKQFLYQTRTNYYKALGDWGSAFLFQAKFTEIRDSLNKIHLADKLESVENQYQLNLKETENELLANKNELLTRQMQFRNILSIISIIVILLIVLTSVIFYRQLKVQKHLSRQLSLKNEEIKTQADELEGLNEGLEQKVLQRTNKIQELNGKLREYAFSNSHLVRAPIARIMGLSQMLTDNQELSNEKRKELQESMRQSAIELDKIIRSLAKILIESDVNTKK